MSRVNLRQVLLTAIQAALLRPPNIESLEMHGTGTPLGDPIEIGAALAVLRGAAHPVALTAAKSHVGHAEPAAGGVSLLQVPKLEHPPASRAAPSRKFRTCHHLYHQQAACLHEMKCENN